MCVCVCVCVCESCCHLSLFLHSPLSSLSPSLPFLSPDPVLHSHSSLSSVEPPQVWFDLKLPPHVIEQVQLSSLQLEAVVYACQQHMNILSDGSRAGFLIGQYTQTSVWGRKEQLCVYTCSVVVVVYLHTHCIFNVHVYMYVHCIIYRNSGHNMLCIHCICVACVRMYTCMCLCRRWCWCGKRKNNGRYINTVYYSAPRFANICLF